MRQLRTLITMVCAVSASLAAASEPAATPTSGMPPSLASNLEPASITAQQHVIIRGDLLPAKGVQVFLKKGDEKSCSQGIPTDTQVTDGRTLMFLVPSNTAPKQYPVCITIDGKEVSYSSQLTVEPDSSAPVSLRANYPLTNYPVGKGFDFELAGKNFARVAQDNVIEVANEGTVPRCETPKSPDTTPTFCLTRLEVVDTTRLKVHGFFPAHYYGPIEIKVHVGNNVSESHSVTFSAATPQGVAVAAAVFGGLALLFMGLVRRSISSYTRGGEKYGALAALFLDRQTDSYSLSKFQVLAWTAVTVYSYIYLFLCRTLIQGNFSTFPGVAQNLPQLFFVSAGTTVAAAAITSNWGSKGAGAPTPSMADFISTGGLVAGDRFQFFIWTVVGCMGYVYLVVRNDPARFTELPNVPDNFLYLMGVSSAGYLGGKLVRKPGPIIKVLSFPAVTSGTESILKGSIGKLTVAAWPSVFTMVSWCVPSAYLSASLSVTSSSEQNLVCGSGGVLPPSVISKRLPRSGWSSTLRVAFGSRFSPLRLTVMVVGGGGGSGGIPGSGEVTRVTRRMNAFWPPSQPSWRWRMRTPCAIRRFRNARPSWSTRSSSANRPRNVSDFWLKRLPLAS